MFSILSVAFAQSEKSQSSWETILPTVIPFILIFVLFYVLMILPQQKRQKKHKALLDALKKGDKVITSSGLIGSVAGVSKDVITLQIADNVRIKVVRSHIAELRSGDEEG